MLSDTAVQILRKLVHSTSREWQEHFRCIKHRSCFKRIRKHLILQAKKCTCLTELVFQYLSLKISTIHKWHCIAVSAAVCCMFICKDHHRIILMAWSSSYTSDHMASMRNWFSLHPSFHRMSSVKCQKIIFTIKEIKTRRLCFLDKNLSISMISNLCTSGDHIIVRKYTIQKCYFYSCNHIFHCNLKCLTFCLFRIDCRKSRNLIFSIRNLMWTVSKITRCTSVCIFNYQSHTSVIPGSVTRILLRKCIHRIGSVTSGIIRIAWKSSVIICQKIIHTASICLLSIIQMKKESKTVYLHLICCIFCLYCKCPVCFTVNNSHFFVSFLCLKFYLHSDYFTAPFTTPFRICFWQIR